MSQRRTNGQSSSLELRMLRPVAVKRQESKNRGRPGLKAKKSLFPENHTGSDTFYRHSHTPNVLQVIDSSIIVIVSPNPESNELRPAPPGWRHLIPAWL